VRRRSGSKAATRKVDRVASSIPVLTRRRRGQRRSENLSDDPFVKLIEVVCGSLGLLSPLPPRKSTRPLPRSGSRKTEKRKSKFTVRCRPASTLRGRVSSKEDLCCAWAEDPTSFRPQSRRLEQNRATPGEKQAPRCPPCASRRVTTGNLRRCSMAPARSNLRRCHIRRCFGGWPRLRRRGTSLGLCLPRIVLFVRVLARIFRPVLRVRGHGV